MNLATLTAARTADRLALIAHDTTGMLCVSAAKARAWLAPWIVAGRLERFERIERRGTRKQRRSTGRHFEALAGRRIGGWSDRLIGELTDPVGWVSDGYVPPGMDRILPDPRHPSQLPELPELDEAAMNRILRAIFSCDVCEAPRGDDLLCIVAGADHEIAVADVESEDA
jgi:hypothetical protein